MLSPFEVVLFDADRTLFDTDAGEREAVIEVFRMHGIEADDLYERYTRINDALWCELEAGRLEKSYVQAARFSLVLEELGIEGDGAEMNRIYLGLFSDCVQLLPHAKEVCAELAKTKRLYIVTNGTASIQEKRLRRTGIWEYMSGVFVSETVGTVKPQKGYFDAVFAGLEPPTPKKKVIIVGDSLTSDMRGGMWYGITTCWFNPHHLSNHTEVVCDYEIDSLLELLPKEAR